MNYVARRLIINLITLLLLSSFLQESGTVVYEVRVQFVKCLDGLDENGESANAWLNCKGASVNAGVFNIKLMPSQERALFRVVVQDPNNPSTEFKKINCYAIWDALNWQCEYSADGISEVYEARNGFFSMKLYTNTDQNNFIPPDLSYSGTVTTGIRARFLSLFD